MVFREFSFFGLPATGGRVWMWVWGGCVWCAACVCVCVCVFVCVCLCVCQELTTQAQDVKVLMGSQNHQVRAKDDPCRFLQVVVHLNGTVARATVGNHSGLVISLRGGGRGGGS